VRSGLRLSFSADSDFHRDGRSFRDRKTLQTTLLLFSRHVVCPDHFSQSSKPQKKSSKKTEYPYPSSEVYGLLFCLKSALPNPDSENEELCPYEVKLRDRNSHAWRRKSTRQFSCKG
jgi:hypothetical protein